MKVRLRLPYYQPGQDMKHLRPRENFAYQDAYNLHIEEKLHVEKIGGEMEPQVSHNCLAVELWTLVTVLHRSH